MNEATNEASILSSSESNNKNFLNHWIPRFTDFFKNDIRIFMLKLKTEHDRQVENQLDWYR